MSIIGLGVDLVEVGRIERLLTAHGERFLERCFTRGERAAWEASGRRTEHLAGRFAAKEAALKALGTGWRHGIAWTEIEIVADDAGRPRLTLTGQALRFARAAGASRWLVSISHAGGFAVASVAAEG